MMFQNLNLRTRLGCWFAVCCLSLLAAIAGHSAIAQSPPPADYSLTPIDLAINPATDSPGSIPDGANVSDNPVADGERGIVGNDDRVLMTSGAYPWSAIGRLEQIDLRRGLVSGWCTGTLIGSDLVLTNAHCVVDAVTHQLATAELVFRPNMIRGESGFSTPATVLDYGTNFDDGNIADDWALLKLDEPLGDYYGTIGWLAPALDRPQVIAALDGKLHLAGYSGDFPAGVPGYEPGETPGIHVNCSITGTIEDGRFRHACDTNGGASGAPIIGQLASGQFVILGLHAGRFTENGEVVNYGMPVDRWQLAAQESR